MKYNELDIVKNKKTNRVGRGISHGQGKTAGRGTKGQNARAGGGVRPGFEGGQSPLMQRLPKLRGFFSHRPASYVIYTKDLDKVSGSKVDNFTLFESNLIEDPYSFTKVIFNGAVTKKLSVNLQSASKNAIAAIEKSGGKFDVTKQVKRSAKSSTKLVK